MIHGVGMTCGTSKKRDRSCDVGHAARSRSRSQSSTMADSGVGIDLDSTAETLAIVYSLAVVSFLGIFTAIMWRMTNEVLIARR